MPVRIKRERTKGWNKPLNTKYVGRGTVYGNPFRVSESVHQMWYDVFSKSDKLTYFIRDKKIDNEDAVYLFEKYALPCILPERIEQLRGFDLMCFCSLDKPCHANSLLKIANQ